MNKGTQEPFFFLKDCVGYFHASSESGVVVHVVVNDVVSIQGRGRVSGVGAAGSVGFVLRGLGLSVYAAD